jgi:hypothetical protein
MNSEIKRKVNTRTRSHFLSTMVASGGENASLVFCHLKPNNPTTIFTSRKECPLGL